MMISTFTTRYSSGIRDGGVELGISDRNFYVYILKCLNPIPVAGEYNLTFPPPPEGGGKEFSSGKRIQEKRENRRKKREKEKGEKKGKKRERKRGKEN